MVGLYNESIRKILRRQGARIVTDRKERDKIMTAILPKDLFHVLSNADFVGYNRQQRIPVEQFFPNNLVIECTRESKIQLVAYTPEKPAVLLRILDIPIVQGRELIIHSRELGADCTLEGRGKSSP